MSEHKNPEPVYEHAILVDYEVELVLAANWAQQAERAADRQTFDQAAVSMSLMHSALAHAKAASQSTS